MTRTRNWIKENPIISGVILLLITGLLTGYTSFVVLGADQAHLKKGFEEHVIAQGMQTKKFATSVEQLGTRSAVIETKVDRIEKDISEIKSDIKLILQKVK